MFQIQVRRGEDGFGFCVSGCGPVKVSRVAGGSPAEAAGLRVDDVVIHVNGLNVTSFVCDSVARVIRYNMHNVIVYDIDLTQASIDNLLISDFLFQT